MPGHSRGIVVAVKDTINDASTDAADAAVVVDDDDDSVATVGVSATECPTVPTTTAANGNTVNATVAILLRRADLRKAMPTLPALFLDDSLADLLGVRFVLSSSSLPTSSLLIACPIRRHCVHPR